MKKFLNIAFMLIVVMLLMTGLAACNSGTSTYSPDLPAETLPAETGSSETADQPYEWTAQELGQTIEAAGTFWENWWHFDGPFAHNAGVSAFVQSEGQPAGVGMSFTPLLPASGFNSLQDIRNHLLQFYTENIVDGEMPFVFREAYGRVYFADARAGFPRFDWTRASHEIVERDGQDSNHIVVKTTVMHGYFILDPGGPVTLYFHMYDGKIDRIEGGSIVTATLDAWGHDTVHHNQFALQLDIGWLFIGPPCDALIGSFEFIHEVDYLDLSLMRDGGVLDVLGDQLVIWASFPMFDFELIGLNIVDTEDDWFFEPSVSYGRVELLNPGQGYVVNNYFGMGTLPLSGFTFFDINGNRHSFFMQHDNSDSPYKFILGSIDARISQTAQTAQTAEPTEICGTGETCETTGATGVTGVAGAHPFATALSEFFINLAEVPEWAIPAPYHTATLPFPTHAIMVDVDGNGTMGVLASKWTIDVQRYLPHSSALSIPVHRLFLLAGDQARPIALDNMAVTPSKRLITMGAVDGQGTSMSAHTLLGFNNGQLSPVKSIVRVAYGYWGYNWISAGVPDSYFVNYHTGEFWNRDASQDLPLTDAGFAQTMARYGLDLGAIPFFWESPDETSRILAMTVN